MAVVSIIIPNYNGAEWLPKTIESCLSQKSELIKEIIVIDDHSTDNSWEVLQRKKAGHSKIQIYKNTKKGANSARNLGFKISSGSYIQFLDADDLLSEKKIELQFEVLQNDPANVVASCGWAHFTSNIQDAQFHPNKIWKNYNDPIKWLTDTWTGGGMMVTSCWLCPRKLIEDSGLWDESLIKNQDGEFFCRVLLNAHSIKFVKKAKVYYRKPQKNNISQRSTYEAAASLLKSYQSYDYHIRQKRDTEEVRFACAFNYLSFIYEFHPKYPSLLAIAKQNFESLGIKKALPIGGARFQKIVKLVGFQNTLFLRKVLNF
jgi:glycosyltransferase involved in cell wall biosynthesis